MREGVSLCAREHSWSWPTPAWASLVHTHVWTTSYIEMQTQAAQPRLAHASATLALLLLTLTLAHTWPLASLHVWLLRPPLPHRLLSQTRAVPPHPQSGLPQLILLPPCLSLFLSFPLFPSPSPSALSSLCHPPRLTPHSLSLSLSFCVSEEGVRLAGKRGELRWCGLSLRPCLLTLH